MRAGRCHAPGTAARTLAAALAEATELEAHIRELEHELDALGCNRAPVAFVGDAARFSTGRDLSSHLGLTARETSSALKRRLGRISEHGDPHPRMLLIHGARAHRMGRVAPRARLHRAQRGGGHELSQTRAAPSDRT